MPDNINIKPWNFELDFFWKVLVREEDHPLLNNKLNNVEETGAELLLTDCPGCVMQLRGGLKKRGSDISVQHTVEALSARKKKKK